MAFPTSPTDAQVATVNGITYVYATSTNTWTRRASASAIFSVLTDTFTGDGTTTSFTLGTTPSSIDLVVVNIDGVLQQKSAYTIANNVITFTGTPIVGAIVEVRSTISTNVGVLTGLVYDTFTGNGSTTAYTLSTSPASRNYTMVTVGGVVQAKSTYSVAGTTLTFSTAPPNTSPVEIVTFGPAVNAISDVVPHPFLMMGT